MFCDSGFGWNSWHMGGWFIPGLFLTIILIAVWFFYKREQPQVVATGKCPKCSGETESSYFRCPHCGETLKHHCPNCSRVMEHDWAYCPHCNEKQSSTTH